MKNIHDDKIPPLQLNTEVGEIIYSALQHDRYKKKIRTMIVDYTGTVEFEELVMKYAGKEYDNRILKSARFWTVTVLSTVITSLIASGIAFFIGNSL